MLYFLWLICYNNSNEDNHQTLQCSASGDSAIASVLALANDGDYGFGGAGVREYSRVDFCGDWLASEEADHLQAGAIGAGDFFDSDGSETYFSQSATEYGLCASDEVLEVQFSERACSGGVGVVVWRSAGAGASWRADVASDDNNGFNADTSVFNRDFASVSRSALSD